MTLENLDIRRLIIESGLQYKQIAELMDVRPDTLSRSMRYKLTQTKRACILAAIDALKQNEKGSKRMTAHILPCTTATLQATLEYIDQCDGQEITAKKIDATRFVVTWKTEEDE